MLGKDSLVALQPAPFLPSKATVYARIRAAAANHTAWFRAQALANDGEIRKERGLTWFYNPANAGEVTVPFPRLTRANADAALDALLAYCREKQPRTVGVWAVTPTRPNDLGVRLVARGWEWGWRPHWMSLDLSQIQDVPLPDGVTIAVDDLNEWEATDLPYYERKEVATFQKLANARPRRMWHFGAWLDGRAVGHSLLYLTSGAQGVAGIYSVGVAPDVQNRGVGKAISLAACRFARERGCHYALLNSAADHLYDRIGFEHLGWGQTWWMHQRHLQAPAPTQAQIAFAEAIGRGDRKRLSQTERPESLDAPLPCGMTPMEFAVCVKQSASAEWLIAQGATLDLLQAWDLGWMERTAQMLAENPALANRRKGDWQLTPMHEAASRGDLELARLLLTAKPDLTLQDATVHSTPLGWARHFRRTALVELLESAESKRSSLL